MRGKTISVLEVLRTSYYTFVSISLCLLWLFTSATCEEPYTFNSMGYPDILYVGAGGIDTLVTGKLPFTDMCLTIRDDGCWKSFVGKKDAEGFGEEVECGWIHVKTTYSMKEVRIRVNPNSEETHRDAIVETSKGSNVIRIHIYQEGSKIDNSK